MFRSIGVVIVLWYLSSLFSQSFSSADSAFSASLHALETAAVASEKRFAE